MSDPHHHPHHVTPDWHDRPDKWHTHTADEERPQRAHAELANAHLILAVGFVSFALVAAAVLVVYGYYTWYVSRNLNELEFSREAWSDPEWNAWPAKENDLRRLRDGFADDTHGEFMPIDKAAEQVVLEYRSRAR